MSGCKILIASPTYNGDVRIEYMRSIIDLLARLRGRDTECSLLTEKATILHTMRSVMASEALADASFTHLLFVDTDMGFRPEAVLRLIDRDVPFAGVAYPYRTVPLHEKLPADLEGTTLRTFTSQLVPYAVTFPPGQKQVQIERGFCKVSTIGTGLMLIRRDVLVRMSEEGSLRRYITGFPYNQWHKQTQYWGFFDPLEENGMQFGEDYSFCRRWVQGCGGDILALVDEEISHIGPLPVLGRYIDKLKTGNI
jgi:hypothetical protein